jgi:hypothetical protein
MGNYRKILSGYFSILEENTTAQYLDCKRIAVDFVKEEYPDRIFR